jgi:predicted nucleic acid-binding protein
LRDLLVQLARAGLYRAKWSASIHDEWIRNLLKERPTLDRRKLDRTVDLMNQAVADCLVADYDHLVPSLILPDPGDLHVLAAALHAKADAIVTFNLRDFPDNVLHPLGLEAIHPDDY